MNVEFSREEVVRIREWGTGLYHHNRDIDKKIMNKLYDLLERRV